MLQRSNVGPASGLHGERDARPAVQPSWIEASHVIWKAHSRPFNPDTAANCSGRRRGRVGDRYAAAAAAFAQQFPTAKVNTTGLAVTDTEVTVGMLHSVTGTMAICETGSIQAEQLAIDQINATGGVLGRKIKIIQEDGASDWPTFAEKAKKLLVNDKVRRGLRLLDLGLAQGGAAGVRAGERPALLPDLLRRPRAVEERDLHRPGSHAADHRRASTGCRRRRAPRPSS